MLVWVDINSIVDPTYVKTTDRVQKKLANPIITKNNDYIKKRFLFCIDEKQFLESDSWKVKVHTSPIKSTHFMVKLEVQFFIA